MKDKELLEMYTDYLLSSFGATTGTGMARMLEGAIRHDRIERFLAGAVKGGAEYGQRVKP